MRLVSLRLLAATATLAFLAGHTAPAWAALDIAQSPLYLQSATPPLNMLVMGKDHKLYYEAYNDASDLNGDGILDIGYKGWELKNPAPTDPAVSKYKIDYYGYFNSYACYNYSATGRFTPVSATTNKQCSGAWSGDYLNYLTTGRGDALKKVLYGGDRSTDTAALTVLQTNYVTHDAHSWGKEYLSVARDGYNIGSYTPLSLPAAGRYHLFAVTSLTNPDGSADAGAPVLRVLRSSPYRIWEWVSIEGPVADTRCLHGGSGPDCVGTTTPAHPGHPGTKAAFNTMETTFAIAANQYGGTVNRTAINCQDADCNPNGTDDDYLTIAAGQIRMANTAAAGGTYRFRIDGDDVIDFELRTNNNWGNATGLVATAGCYTTAGRGFGACAGNEMSALVTLARNTTYYYKFRHEEGSGGDGYRLQWTKTAGVLLQPAQLFGWTTFDSTNNFGSNVNTGANVGPSFEFYNLRPPQSNGSSRDTDRFVRVEVCPATANLREANCKLYPDGNYKPTGVLHDYGETDRMFFGMISGSQINNLQGGILRKNMSSFSDEINASNGTYKIAAGTATALDGADGIVGTFKSLRMIGGSGGQGSNWAWGGGTGDCPSIGNRAIVNGECRMWGNPIGEMMFEGLRYFAGGAAYNGFTSTPSGHGNGVAEETTMNLSAPAWKDPYATVAAGGLGYRACAKPVMTVVSDINPSYDSNLPGNPWNSVSITSPATISDFNAASAGSTIWNHEFGGARSVYIGEVGGTADSAPSAKTASSFGNIRGLAPEEPTKEGTYYSASVAYYGKTNDEINANSVEAMSTYSVAVASPLPKIEFPVGDNKLTLLPFAKTVSGTFGDGTRKPTNTIVDFYVEKIVNLPGQPTDATINAGRGYALFRINYEDVEQGNDHDMDAIVRYEVKTNSNDTVTVTLTSEYAAGSANHALGYTMTGTTKDGIYLEVCDLRDGQPNGGGRDSCSHQTNYAFNTPPGRDPGYCAANPTSTECAGLPPTATRTFTVGSSGANQLRDPLWFAAKYGGFDDKNNNGLPDAGEWDSKVAGTPDNYFLVTNALTLKDQLAEAFSKIEADSKPTGGVAASGARRDAGFLAFIPKYFTENWTGDIDAYRLLDNGEIGAQVWSAADSMPTPTARNIYAVKTPGKTGVLNVGAFTRAGLTNGAITAQIRLGLPTLSNTQIDNVINYLRGDQSLEEKNGGAFRNRDRVLGDILNSQPEVLNTGNYSYVRLQDTHGGDTYNDFLDDKAERDPVLFVGANDGMIHAFDAREEGGEELFAVIPSTALPNLKELTNPGYLHRYYADASPVQRDAYINGGWKTVLVSGMGAGGKSIIALDVTDPAAGFTATNVLWEFTHPDLGYTFGQPRIGILQDGTWVAVFGNGYNSTRQRASLFVVRLSDGELLKKIEVEALTDAQALLDPNGMSSPELASLDDDIYIDTAYVGDYHGNLWKINLAGAATTWGIAGGGTAPMFQAIGPGTTAVPGGKRQMITGSIGLSRHHLGGMMVFFGTGRYMLTGDNSVDANPDVESFYGLWDRAGTGAISPITNRSLLQQQQLGQQGSTDSSIARTGTNNAVRWDEKAGWFLDLKLDGVAADGERVLGLPTIGLGRVVFTTFTPLGNECTPGGENWLYVLSASTGGVSLPTSEFVPDDSAAPDPVGGGACTGDCAVSGSSLGSGPPTVAPPIVTTPPSEEADPDEAGLMCSASKIRIQVLTPDGLKEFACMTPGRSSWREIR